MQNPFRLSLRLTFLALFLIPLLGTPPASAQSLVTFAPAEAEIVARLDVKQLVASPLFDLVLEHYGKEKATAQAKVIQNLVGLDVFNDIEELALFGRIDEDESIIIVARGRFNEEKMLDLVRLNDRYQAEQRSGSTVHSWVDDGHKHAVFLPQGILAIAGSSGAMEVLLRTKANASTGFLNTPAGRSVPSENSRHMLWGALVRTPGIDGEFGDFARATDLQSALLTLDSSTQGLSAALTLIPDSADLGELYQSIADGGLAMAKLLSEEHELARLAATHLSVGIAEDGYSAQVKGTVTNQMAFDTIRKLKD